jgi:hypothetical protein
MIENIKAGADIHAGDGGYGIGTQENYDAFVKVRNKSLAEARIRELAEQAGDSLVDSTLSDWSIPNEFVEKFAELIVRECARVARATACPYTDDRMIQHLGHTWDMACVESGNEIVKHFGIK